MAVYLTRATSDPQSSSTTATYSVWIKRSALGSDQCIWSGSYYSNDNIFQFKFLDSDKLSIYSRTGATTRANLTTAQVFRDVSAWYHIVIAIDTTQGTEANRIKCYVNGELATVTGSYPSQNQNLYLDAGAGAGYYIGRRGDNAEYFSGSMSHFHYVDGTALAATVFGSTDSTTGEWKINTSPSYTVGAKGFFLLKDGNSVTDASANSNNFTITNGTLTKTEDCPSNVFATLNPLVPYSSNYNFSNGNTTVENDGSSASWTTRWGVSTLGMEAGKFYAEAKVADIGTNQMYALGLVKDISSFAPSSSVGSNAIGYYSTGDIYNSYGNDQSGLSSFTTNDIIGIAFDKDNGTAQWYKNGSTIGSAVTGLSTDGTWFIVTNFYSNGKVYHNFGNGYFGSTQISSAGSNASGIGIFEYDVPSGYTALSTKGLNL